MDHGNDFGDAASVRARPPGRIERDDLAPGRSHFGNLALGRRDVRREAAQARLTIPMIGTATAR